LPHPARDDGNAAAEVEERVAHGAIVLSQVRPERD
jgi:hypothetical protein